MRPSCERSMAWLSVGRIAFLLLRFRLPSDSAPSARPLACPVIRLLRRGTGSTWSRSCVAVRADSATLIAGSKGLHGILPNPHLASMGMHVDSTESSSWLMTQASY